MRINPIAKFEDGGLHPITLKNIQLAGYTVPTPIQKYCIPAIKMGHDVIGIAQTGKFTSHYNGARYSCILLTLLAAQALERLPLI